MLFSLGNGTVRGCLEYHFGIVLIIIGNAFLGLDLKENVVLQQPIRIGCAVLNFFEIVLAHIQAEAEIAAGNQVLVAGCLSQRGQCGQFDFSVAIGCQEFSLFQNRLFVDGLPVFQAIVLIKLKGNVRDFFSGYGVCLDQAYVLQIPGHIPQHHHVARSSRLEVVLVIPTGAFQGITLFFCIFKICFGNGDTAVGIHGEAERLGHDVIFRGSRFADGVGLSGIQQSCDGPGRGVLIELNITRNGIPAAVPRRAIHILIQPDGALTTRERNACILNRELQIAIGPQLDDSAILVPLVEGQLVFLIFPGIIGASGLLVQEHDLGHILGIAGGSIVFLDFGNNCLANAVIQLIARWRHQLFQIIGAGEQGEFTLAVLPEVGNSRRILYGRKLRSVLGLVGQHHGHAIGGHHSGHLVGAGRVRIHAKVGLGLPRRTIISVQRFAIGPGLGELNDAPAFQVVGIAFGIEGPAVIPEVVISPMGHIVHAQIKGNAEKLRGFNPGGAVLTGIRIPAVGAHGEFHAVFPQAVVRIGAGFHQGIGAGNEILLFISIGSVRIANQVAVGISQNIGDIGGIIRIRVIGSGIDIEFDTRQFFDNGCGSVLVCDSLFRHTGSQIGGGLAQIDKAIHHPVGGNGFGARKGRLVRCNRVPFLIHPVLVLIGDNVGAVGVVCHRFPVDLGLHRPVGNFFSIRSVLRQIIPAIRFGIVLGIGGKCTHLSRNIRPGAAALNLLLKLEGGSEAVPLFLGIGGVPPLLCHRIFLQLDIGESILRGKCACLRGGFLGFVAGNRMLHHFVMQHIAFPVILGKARPLHRDFPGIRGFHGLLHAAGLFGMTLPIVRILA